MGVASVLSDRGAPGRVRRAGAGVLGADRAGHRVRGVAADRLGDEGPLLHRAARRRGADPLLRRPATAGDARRATARLRCCICERDYEGPDMAHCPAYQGPICSLCCSLDARCGDLCKPDARLATQARDAVHALLPRRLWPAVDGGLGALAGADGCRSSLLLAGVCALLYQQELRALGDAAPRVVGGAAPVVHQRVRDAAAGQRHRRLVGGAHAPEPARGAGGEQPPDAGARRADGAADAGDRLAPPHRRRAAARQGRRRRRQPGQEPLHLHAEPRAAHAAQQRDRLRAAARRRSRAAGAPAPGGQRDPARRRAPAVADRGHARPGAHRERQGVAGDDDRCTSARPSTSSPTCSSCRPAPRACASVREFDAGAAAVRARRRAPAAPDPDQRDRQRRQVHRPRRR